MAVSGHEDTSDAEKGKQTITLGRWIPQKHLSLKARGAEFYKFLQPVRLKAWNFKNPQAQLWESPKGIRKGVPALKKTTRPIAHTDAA